MIGGWLYSPAKRFPGLFGQNEFLKSHPYFLPCALPATFSLSACIVSFLFLEETLLSPIPVLQYLGLRKPRSQPQQINAPPVENTHSNISQPSKQQPLPFRSLFTPRVIMASGNYASLAVVEIAFRSIQPLFYSTPIGLGGLGLSTAKIGNILAVFGILNGLFQACFFARINERWGSRTTFMYAVGSAIPCFAMFPLLSYIAQKQGYSSLLWVGVGIQVVASVGMCSGYGKSKISYQIRSEQSGSHIS